MTDKMREAYKLHRAKLAGQLIQGEDWPGAYRRAEELLSWQCFEAGWRASREALVIELPQQSGANRDWNQAIRYCRQAIETAGLLANCSGSSPNE